MQFSHNVTYPANFEKVITTNFSEEFYSSLTELLDTATPKVTSHSDDGTTLVCETFWEHTGQLDPMAKALLGGKPLTWVTTTTIDRESKTGTINTVYMEGKIPGTCEAKVTFTEDGGSTTRDLEGEIIVKIMMAGPTVEKRLVEAIEIRQDLEAKALIARLGE
ncbi:MAG TPA: DUF2505 family protein [Acidimicrobiia bacterium]|nr:DUF2505 family protein [Acidimicrobiia bacterium]